MPIQLYNSTNIPLNEMQSGFSWPLVRLVSGNIMFCARLIVGDNVDIIYGQSASFMTAKACNPSQVPLRLLSLWPLIKCIGLEHAYRMSPVFWRLANGSIQILRVYLFTILPWTAIDDFGNNKTKPLPKGLQSTQNISKIM